MKMMTVGRGLAVLALLSIAGMAGVAGAENKNKRGQEALGFSAGGFFGWQSLFAAGTSWEGGGAVFL